MDSFSLFSSDHKKNSYVFFDLETTGFYPMSGDRIIEIAMIKMENGSVTDKFETFINPLRPIPEDASRVNNIFDKDVQDRPVFDIEVSNKIVEFIGNAILVAHNASFDLGFLSVELAKNGITFYNWKSIDTLQIAKYVFPGQKNKLKSLIDRYGIKKEGDLHRAMVDTEALVDVFFNLADEELIRNLDENEMIKRFGYHETSESYHNEVSEQIRYFIENDEVLSADYQTKEGIIRKLSLILHASVWNNRRWYIYATNAKTNDDVFLYSKRIKCR